MGVVAAGAGSLGGSTLRTWIDAPRAITAVAES